MTMILTHLVSLLNEIDYFKKMKKEIYSVVHDYFCNYVSANLDHLMVIHRVKVNLY